MLRILKVSGDSLDPHLKDGDFVLTSKIPVWLNRTRQGDLIAFNHQEFGVMVKKLDHITPDRRGFFLVGTSPNSIDSRVLGWIDKNDLVGKVIVRVRNPNR